MCFSKRNYFVLTLKVVPFKKGKCVNNSYTALKIQTYILHTQNNDHKICWLLLILNTKQWKTLVTLVMNS